MPVSVTTESPILRPWINQTPTDEGDKNKCETKKWACMKKGERDAYVKERAESVVEVFT